MFWQGYFAPTYFGRGYFGPVVSPPVDAIITPDAWVNSELRLAFVIAALSTIGISVPGASGSTDDDHISFASDAMNQAATPEMAGRGTTTDIRRGMTHDRRGAVKVTH